MDHKTSRHFQEVVQWKSPTRSLSWLKNLSSTPIALFFLTGKAGTGKTTFLHTIKNSSPKRLVVTAPTGVAAINAGGVTLHSFFQIPFGPFIPGGQSYTDQHRVRKEKINIIRSLDLLIIDEISMVRADLLDAVDSILRRYRRSDQAFGGVQLLMIGDLHQLAPVVKKSDRQILQAYYDSPYFFSSTALARTELICVELKHIYRQSDQRFIDLLNRVRDNRIDAATLEQINSRHRADFSPGRSEAISLYARITAAPMPSTKPGSNACPEITAASTPIWKVISPSTPTLRPQPWN